MKLCKNCGTPQKDENFRCVECGAILPKPLSDREEEIIEEQISDYIDEAADRSDDFYVGTREKILIAADILGLVMSFVVMIFFSPETQGDAICLWCALLFVLGAVNTAFPKLGWEIEKIRLARYVDASDLSPSDHYVVTRKITNIAIPVIGALILLFVAFESGTSPSGTHIGTEVIQTEMGEIIIDRYVS